MDTEQQPRTIRLNLDVRADFLRELKREALGRDVTVSALVRTILAHWLAEVRRQRLTARDASTPEKAG